MDESDAVLALLAWYRRLLVGMGNPWALDECNHRKIAFAWHMLSTHHNWQRVPRVVSVQLPPAVRISWLRLLAANSLIPARHYTFIRTAPAYHERLCRKCALRQVADERHILLVCSATDAVRARFRPAIGTWGTSLQSFIYNNSRSWVQIALFADAALKLWAASRDVNNG